MKELKCGWEKYVSICPTVYILNFGPFELSAIKRGKKWRWQICLVLLDDIAGLSSILVSSSSVNRRYSSSYAARRGAERFMNRLTGAWIKHRGERSWTNQYI